MLSTSIEGAATDLPLQLPATVDLAAAEDLLASLRQRVSSGRPLCVDGAAVETLSLPGIQIMLAASRSHGPIVVRNPSAGFVGAFEDLGIDWMQDLECSQQPVVAAAEEPNEGPGVEGGSQAEIDRGDFAAQTLVEEDEKQAASSADDFQSISESSMNTRILTIDDSKTMRDMLMLTLAEAGFDVLQAVDGQDGLDVLVNEQVDVVITDINMPRMDGYEVIRQLRRKPEHQRTPILVLTTESELEKKELAREAGATGWLVKPFDPDRLIETVRKVAL